MFVVVVEFSAKSGHFRNANRQKVDLWARVGRAAQKAWGAGVREAAMGFDSKFDTTVCASVFVYPAVHNEKIALRLIVFLGRALAF